FNFTVYENKHAVRNVIASKRFYSSQNISTTEVGIQNHGLLSQLYIAPGHIDDQGLVVHLWWKPYVICVWLGAIMMAMGGCFSLFGYWFRIGLHRRIASRFKFSEKALR
ncbi:cytochrome c-type biogenesis CcmF C-terminal domain-containing protein, partial [Bartonella sp. MR168JLCBS]